MRLLQAVSAFTTLIVVSCAVPQPPPGGPEDKIPPAVTETSPGDSSVGISPEAVISLTFSENMTRTKLERLITFYPNIPIKKVGWKRKTIRLTPETPLHPETTYVVVLKAGFRDSHNVSSIDGYEFAFATSAAIDSGSISGTIFFRRKPTQKGIVHLFVIPRDSSFSPATAKPDREVTTNKNGNFVFHYLPTQNTRFIVWAFHDQSDNERFEPDKEAGDVYPDTISLTATVPVAAGKDVYIVDPNEPGEVTGTVVNRTTVDSIAVSVTLYAENDSTPPTHYTTCNPEGDYTFDNVRAGKYILKAFIDILADSLCSSYPCPEDTARDCSEPCVSYPDTVRIAPGDKVKLEALILE